ncbi:MAG: DUF6069 family protein [Acidimicrobiales bacterium]
MSVSTAALTTPYAPPRPTSLRRLTVGAGLAAAAAVTAVAAAVRAAGVPFSAGGPIPLAAFAQMTFLGALVGGVTAAVLSRRSAAPRRRFLQVTGVLLALSCVPSVALPPDVATKASLVVLHLVAAAMTVPVLARRLDA